MSASRTWSAALELADTQALSVYDAMYLELAVRMRMPLATLDRALLEAARSAGADGLAIDWAGPRNARRVTLMAALDDSRSVLGVDFAVLRVHVRR